MLAKLMIVDAYNQVNYADQDGYIVKHSMGSVVGFVRKQATPKATKFLITQSCHSVSLSEIWLHPKLMPNFFHMSHHFPVISHILPSSNTVAPPAQRMVLPQEPRLEHMQHVSPETPWPQPKPLPLTKGDLGQLYNMY